MEISYDRPLGIYTAYLRRKSNVALTVPQSYVQRQSVGSGTRFALYEQKNGVLVIVPINDLPD